MEHKLDCNIVKDLMPTYLEHLTSETASAAIEEHLKECTDCSEYIKQMQGIITLNYETAPEVKEVKQFLNKTKHMYLLKGMFFTLFLLPVIICFIVDIALNLNLTWSLIVAGSCGLAFLVISILIYGKKYRIVKALACLSVLVIPFLGLIQLVTNAYLLQKPIYWFGNYGIPICLLWLAVLWIPIVLTFLLRLNVTLCFSMILILAAFGNGITNVIWGEYSSFSKTALQINSGVIIDLTIGCILFIVGVVLQVAVVIKRRNNLTR